MKSGKASSINNRNMNATLDDQDSDSELDDDDFPEATQDQKSSIK